MTGRSLAESYLRKAEARLLALDTLMGAQAFSDVVQEAQEIVELTLKAACAWLVWNRPRCTMSVPSFASTKTD